MAGLKFLIVAVAVASVVGASPTVVDVVQDIYKTCLQDFSVSCVRPKALGWINYVADKDVINLTDDLALVKNNNVEAEDRSYENNNILDRFDHFLVGHSLVAKVPSGLATNGALSALVPRGFSQPEPIAVPLASTGRSSKIVKKVIFPFLLGLKFKTAFLVPLALGLIALKTWKALTLGLISLVLTGAVAIFSKFVKPPQYEVVHYPHVDHHLDIVPLSPAVPVAPVAAPVPVYGAPVYRHRRAIEMAYRGHL
ncbi:hypothetical protein GWI33_007062 [Rhynchophorus ferrugineus]|uniref:Osiris 18 n=1 Tax=Rhynchophorus ferrugineus TaxID=354439 RepID=A0A834IJD8_RHYFE|nr:hypothetical protein GWI33_007062 [Rhynchophorus ferrugineus]